MTKRQMIDEILSENPTAQPAFLARFEDADLDEYLSHLKVLRTPRLTGDASRFGRYFATAQSAAAVEAAPLKAQEAGVTAQEKRELMESPAEPVAAAVPDVEPPALTVPVPRPLAPTSLMKQTPFASNTVSAASVLF